MEWFSEEEKLDLKQLAYERQGNFLEMMNDYLGRDYALYSVSEYLVSTGIFRDMYYDLGKRVLNLLRKEVYICTPKMTEKQEEEFLAYYRSIFDDEKKLEATIANTLVDFKNEIRHVFLDELRIASEDFIEASFESDEYMTWEYAVDMMKKASSSNPDELFTNWMEKEPYYRDEALRLLAHHYVSWFLRFGTTSLNNFVRTLSIKYAEILNLRGNQCF